MPDDPGYRLTWRRIANLYLNRYEVRALRRCCARGRRAPVIE
jgi:hypothetical protein